MCLQAGWLRKCICKYSTEVFKFVLEILEKSKVIANVIPRKCATPLENTKAKKGDPKLCGFLLIIHALSNSFQEIPHAITSTRSQFHVFKPIVLGVFLLE